MKRAILITAGLLLAPVVWADHHEEGESSMAEMPDAAAMQAMQAMLMAATPGEPHAKLAETVGSYTAEMKFYMDPDAEPMVANMTVERVMDVQDRVLVETWQGEAMGAQFEGHGRTGYDNVTKQYWSTWTDNMSTGVLVFRGNYDADEKAMVLTSKSTHAVTGAPYSMRSVAYLPEPGREVMDMYEDHGQGEIKTMSFVLTKK